MESAQFFDIFSVALGDEISAKSQLADALSKATCRTLKVDFFISMRVLCDLNLDEKLLI